MLRYANWLMLCVHTKFLINVCIIGKIQEVKSAECSYLIYIFLSFHSQIQFGNPGSGKGKGACVCLTAGKCKTFIMLMCSVNLQ